MLIIKFGTDRRKHNLTGRRIKSQEKNQKNPMGILLNEAVLNVSEWKKNSGVHIISPGPRVELHSDVLGDKISSFVPKVPDSKTV